jgi:hypothetical protein
MTTKQVRVVLASAVVLGAVLSTQVLAQRGGPAWRGGGGWGMQGAYGRMYDPKTVETLKGEVTAVELFTPMSGMHSGVHLQLKTAKETINVHLGPSWYIENQDTKIEAQDKIEVKGSRVMIEGKPAIIAAEIKKGSEVLKLRDETGAPYWAGWRRHAANPS